VIDSFSDQDIRTGLVSYLILKQNPKDDTVFQLGLHGNRIYTGHFLDDWKGHTYAGMVKSRQSPYYGVGVT
jgi:hypothetical protein